MTNEQRKDFLHGNDREFDREEYLVDSIRRNLLTEEQRKVMFDHNFTIEDMLNGRIAGDERREAAAEIFDAWNAELGQECFFHYR